MESSYQLFLFLVQKLLIREYVQRFQDPGLQTVGSNLWASLSFSFNLLEIHSTKFLNCGSPEGIIFGYTDALNRKVVIGGSMRLFQEASVRVDTRAISLEHRCMSLISSPSLSADKLMADSEMRSKRCICCSTSSSSSYGNP